MTTPTPPDMLAPQSPPPQQSQGEAAQQEDGDPFDMGCSQGTLLMVRERQLANALRESAIYQGAALEARAIAAELRKRLGESAAQFQQAADHWSEAERAFTEEIARLKGEDGEQQPDLDVAAQVVDGQVLAQALAGPREDLPVEPAVVEPEASTPKARKRTARPADPA